MGIGLNLGRIHLAGNILGLGFLCKYHRHVKILSHYTGNTDSGSLNGKNFIDLAVRKSPLKLFSDLRKQLNVHLMI